MSEGQRQFIRISRLGSRVVIHGPVKGCVIAILLDSYRVIAFESWCHLQATQFDLIIVHKLFTIFDNVGVAPIWPRQDKAL